MVAEVRGMRAVHDQYGKLEHVVDNLNEKTRGLLLRERREFLAAYRGGAEPICTKSAGLCMRRRPLTSPRRASRKHTRKLSF